MENQLGIEDWNVLLKMFPENISPIKHLLK